MKDIRKLLGKRIKELRKQKNLTQEDLAELAGVDSRNISHIECGDIFPTKTLLKLAESLNSDLSELFDFEHLKEDLNYKKQFINKSIEEFPEDKINIIYRVTRALK